MGADCVAASSSADAAPPLLFAEKEKEGGLYPHKRTRRYTQKSMHTTQRRRGYDKEGRLDGRGRERRAVERAVMTGRR